MAVVWIIKSRGHQDVERVYGPELLESACSRFIEQGYRHYFYGGSPEVNAALVRELKIAHPGLIVAGYKSPAFRTLSSEELEADIKDINSSKAHILWVALGAPRQEQWMAANLRRLDVPIMIGVGAAFDFIAGYKKQAPHWMRRLGFEWLFRLLQEPARLWPRYRQYPRFIFLLLLQVLGIMKFPIK
jgi:N-acetylglucosaminyldiphosphoundecaprenol N-acetyl-beta-D-mannosaminyltransferase